MTTFLFVIAALVGAFFYLKPQFVRMRERRNDRGTEVASPPLPTSSKGAWVSRKAALKAHGHTGSMTVMMVRFVYLSWSITVLSLLVLALVISIAIRKPPVIQYVDKKTNQIIGLMDVTNSEVRSDVDYELASKRFAENFITQDAGTVLQSKYIALAMMSPELRKHWKKIWLDTNTVNVAKDRKMQCVVMIDQKRFEQYQQDNGVMMVRTKGQMDCVNTELLKYIEPFDLRFALKAGPWRWDNTLGVDVVSLFDISIENKEPANAPAPG